MRRLVFVEQFEQTRLLRLHQLGIMRVLVIVAARMKDIVNADARNKIQRE